MRGRYAHLCIQKNERCDHFKLGQDLGRSVHIYNKISHIEKNAVGTLLLLEMLNLMDHIVNKEKQGKQIENQDKVNTPV